MVTDGETERGCRDLVPVLLWLVVWPAEMGVDGVCENIHKQCLKEGGAGLVKSEDRVCCSLLFKLLSRTAYVFLEYCGDSNIC